MTAFFYLSKQYLKTFFAIFATIIAIVFIVDGIDQYAFIKGYGGNFKQSMLYVLLRLPNSVYNFLPLTFMLSSLAFFLNLSRHSELVALRAAGVPAVKMVLAPVIATLILSLIIIGPYHYMMVSTRSLSKVVEDSVKGRPNETIRTVSNGIWVRETINGEKRFIYINHVNWRDHLFENMEIFITGNHNVSAHIMAKSGELSGGYWKLDEAILVNTSNGNDRENLAEMTLPTDIKFDELFSVYLDPKLVALHQMPAFLSRLKDDGYDSLPAETLFYSELASPLFYAFLCLMGAIFALAPMRGGGTSRRVLYALAVGFTFFFLAKLSESAAKAGNIPVLIGVLAIPVSGIFFATSLLLHQEDG